MPKAGSGYQGELSQAERGIIEKFIAERANNGITARTQKKQRHVAYVICHLLHGQKPRATLDKATGEQFAKLGNVEVLKGKNTRQTVISQLKAMVRYIDENIHQIPGKEKILEKVKAGSPSKQNKDVLSFDQWEKLLNFPMSSKERAYLAVLYDGYHRPGEPYVLKWSDLKINEAGAVQYSITFKTEFPRVIVQKPDTTAILEMWRKECGANYGDDKLIFPDLHGDQYKSLIVATKLFRRLKKATGFHGLKPSMIRNTAITHDVENQIPLSYICLRAWGEPYNEMINIYTMADSAKIQNRQHGDSTKPIEETKPRIIKSLKPCPVCARDNAVDGSFCVFCGASMRGDDIGIFNKLRDENAEMKAQLSKMQAVLDTITSIDARVKKSGISQLEIQAESELL